MTRSFFLRHAWVVAACLSCQPPAMPELTLSVGTVRVDVEATVTVTAINGDATPGTGTVALTTTLGTLDSTSLQLMDGSARTRLRCPRGTQGCANGGSLEVTARWMTSSGAVTRTVTVRVTDPPPFDGGGLMDAGGVDGGRDGGSDAGDVDAGEPEDAGPVILEGTPLNLDAGEVLVLGRLGTPRTLGFSTMTAPTAVSVGLDGVPESALVYADRLVYLRRGVAYLWIADDLDGGPPREYDGGAPDAGDVDGGAPDAGALDAGLRDGGADGGAGDGGALDGGDGGPPTGPFPLFNPEANDVPYADCTGLFGSPDAGFLKALLPTPRGRVWVACAANPTLGVTLYRRDGVLLSGVPVQPLAAHDNVVLGLALDGGLVQVSRSGSVSSLPPGLRRFSRQARAVPGGFELISQEPATLRCALTSVPLGAVTTTELALHEALATEPDCLNGRFAGPRDALLFAVNSPDGVSEVPFLRDGGTPDGGGGLYPAGPPSDFLAMPPALSVDFSGPVWVLPAP